MVASDEDTHHLLQQTTRRQLIRQPVTFQGKGRSNMSGPERPRRTRESASSPKRKQRVRRRPKGREKGSACETRGTGQTVKRDASFFRVRSLSIRKSLGSATLMMIMFILTTRRIAKGNRIEGSSGRTQAEAPAGKKAETRKSARRSGRRALSDSLRRRGSRRTKF